MMGKIATSVNFPRESLLDGTHHAQVKTIAAVQPLRCEQTEIQDQPLQSGPARQCVQSSLPLLTHIAPKNGA